MSTGKRCGPHVELAKNDAARITRCGCGQVHLTLLGNGVSVQIAEEKFRSIVAAMHEAAHELDETTGESAPLSRVN